MKGSYRIIVQNAKVRYDFEIRRNITIVKGNSATGKTTLVELIREYYENGEESGISLSCEKACIVLVGRDWENALAAKKECIVFVDEGNRFVHTKEFAGIIQKTDNYYVIVTREGLVNCHIVLRKFTEFVNLESMHQSNRYIMNFIVYMGIIHLHRK